MDIKKISEERTKEIIDIVIEDRLLELKRLLKEDQLKEGDEFILTEIFNEEEWSGLYYYPGNWTIGGRFGYKLKKSNLPIIRHPDGKKRKKGAVYIVDGKL